MIEVSKQAGLWTVTLRRPEKANSLTKAMLVELAEVAETVINRRKGFAVTLLILVEDANRMAFGKEFVHQVGADKAVATENQGVHIYHSLHSLMVVSAPIQK